MEVQITLRTSRSQRKSRKTEDSLTPVVGIESSIGVSLHIESAIDVDSVTIHDIFIDDNWLCKFFTGFLSILHLLSEKPIAVSGLAIVVLLNSFFIMQ